jgi:hypothetical protein
MDAMSEPHVLKPTPLKTDSQMSQSSPITIDNARGIALNRVRTTRADAKNKELRIDDVEMKGTRWIISGSWDVSSNNFIGRMGFDLELDYTSGAVLRERYGLRPGSIA